MAKGGTLKIRVVGDDSKFSKTLDKAQGKLGKFSSKVGKVAKTMAKVGAVGIAGAGAAAVGAAFKIAEAGDEIAKSAGKAGVGVEQFQELRFAFGQGGVEAGTFDTALQKFNKRLGESATTGGTADESFERLNVSLRDADGNVRDAGGAMDEVLPKLAAIESDAERAAVAGDLFGQRAGPELAAALSDGVGGIDEARQKAQDLGIVMGEKATKSAEKFTDSWDDIKQSAGGLLRQGLTPVMTMLADKVFPFIQTKVIPALRQFGEWLGPKLQTAGQAVAALWDSHIGPAFQALGDWWDTNGPAIIKGAQALWDGLKTVFDAVGKAVETVAGLFTSSGDTATGVFADISAFAEEVWPKISGIVEDAVELIKTVIERVLDGLRIFWDTWGESIIKILSAAWETIKGVVSGALDVIQGIIDTVMGILTGDWERAWEGIKGILSGVWEIIKSVVTGAIDIVLGVLEGVLETIKDVWQAAWGWVTDKVSEIWENVKSTVSDGIEGVLEFVASLPERIKDFFSDAGEWLLDAGKKIIQGLIDGIKSMIGNIGKAISDAAEVVTRHWPFSPAKEGPLRDHPMLEAGMNIGSDVSRGIEKSRRLVEASTSKLAAMADQGMRSQFAEAGVTPQRGLTDTSRRDRDRDRRDDERSGPLLNIEHYEVHSDTDEDRLVRQLAMHARGRV